jgi:hypothetical protein
MYVHPPPSPTVDNKMPLMRAPKSTQLVCAAQHQPTPSPIIEPVVVEATIEEETIEEEEPFVITVDPQQERADAAIGRMGGYLLRGFIMLNATCPNAGCPVCFHSVRMEGDAKGAVAKGQAIWT